MQSILDTIYRALGWATNDHERPSSTTPPTPPPPVQNKLIRRLPPELRSAILARCGIQACVAVRDILSLELLVVAHLKNDQHSRSLENRALDLCMGAKWSTGVQLLIDHDFERSYERWSWRGDVAGVKLAPAAVRKLWRYRRPINGTSRPGNYTLSEAALACLAYNATPAIDGDGDIARWCCQRSPTFVDHLGEELIRAGGDIDSLRALFQHVELYIDDRDLVKRLAPAAAQVGRVDLLCAFEQVYSEAIHKSSDLLSSAARGGNIDAVKYIHSVNKVSKYDRAMTAALEHGHHELAEWLFERRPVGEFTIDLLSAARGGRLELFQRLCQLSPPATSTSGYLTPEMTEITREAMGNPSGEILRWLVEYEPAVRQAFKERSYRPGPPATFQLLYAQSDASTKANLRCKAAFQGRMDLLEWLVRTSRRACDSQMVAMALKAGYYEVAVWLCERLALDVTTVERAHRGDIAYAWCRRGMLQALQDLYRRAPFKVKQLHLRLAFEDGNVALVTWLHDLDPSLIVTPDMCLLAIHSGSLPILKWTAARFGAGSLPSDAMHQAKLADHPHIVEWLSNTSNLVCTGPPATNAAFRSSDIDEWVFGIADAAFF
ncbi:hypothetical protein RI367_007771 [Sorochytrium milnesiophthora]